MVLMRTDPFRELDRLTQQVFGTTTTSRIVAMSFCEPRSCIGRLSS